MTPMLDDEIHTVLRDLAGRVVGIEGRHETVLTELRISRKESSQELQKISAKLDSLTVEVSEYRGALRFGKWAASILIALGVPAALLAYWGGHPR